MGGLSYFLNRSLAALYWSTSVEPRIGATHADALEAYEVGRCTNGRADSEPSFG